MNFIAQDTQPVITGLPSWAVGILAVIGALSPLFFAWLAYKRAGEAKAVAHAAQNDAAYASGATDATQESITRVTDRMNATQPQRPAAPPAAHDPATLNRP